MIHLRTKSPARRSMDTATLLFAAGLVAAVGVLLLFFFRRTLNLDEGWYLLAAQSVQRGLRPYIDFNYTQGPVMPWVYAQMLRWLPLSLISGRALTLIFTLITWSLTIFSSWRLYGKTTAIITLWLLALGWFAVAQYSYVATYALAGALLMAGFTVWATTAWRWRWEIAGVFLALAVGVRLSLLPVLVLFYVAGVWNDRRAWPQRWLALLPSVITLLALFVPFWRQDPQLLWYNLLEFHTDRITLAEHWQIWQHALIWDGLLFPLFWVLLIPKLGFGKHPIRLSWRRPHILSPQRWLLLAVLVLFGVHLIPRTADAYYNTLQYPLMSILMAYWIWQCWRRSSAKLLLGISLMALLLSSQWLAVQHDHLFWQPHSVLTDVARWHDFMQTHVTPECRQQGVSFTPLLAIEGKSKLAPGLEMGIFSYRPTWSATRSRKFHAVNNEILADMLRTPQVGWAAFSRYDLESHLYGDLDEIKTLLQTDFRPAKTFPALGADSSEIYLYLRPGCFRGDMPQKQNVSWQNGIQLIGSSWEPQGTLTLLWRSQQPIDKDYTIFIHILDENGVLVFGHDEPPCRGRCTTSTWLPNEPVLDEHVLALPTLPPGKYQLELGLYDESVQRLLLESGEDAWIMPLQTMLPQP